MNDSEKQVSQFNQRQIDNIAVKCNKIKPLVVISCITYNHGPYIRDALDGFVMQKTNFSFVAIVHDDASTDNTADILREYADRYPDIILPIYELENQYSKGGGEMGLILRKAREATGAKYVALCEGDDYWTDPKKLQKQVDFLEAHPDYSMCFHNAIVYYEKNRIDNVMVDGFDNLEITPLKLYCNWPIPTASILFRSKVYCNKIYLKSMQIPNANFGDVQVGVGAGFEGKIHFINECMSVYRRLESGAVSKMEKNRWPTIRTRIRLSKVYGKEFVSYEKNYCSLYFFSALKNITTNWPDNLYMTLRVFWFAPLQSLRQLKWIYRSIRSKFD